MTLSTIEFNGDRLRQARDAVGISAVALAEILGVSKQAVSRWEKGLDAPRANLFERICQILGQPAYFFLRSTVANFSHGATFYRSLHSATKTARQRAETKKLWAREIAYEVEQYVEFPRVNFPDFGIENPIDLTPSQIDEYAYQLRDSWGMGKSLAVSHLVRIVELNGGLVIRDYLDAHTLDALSEWLMPENRPIIVLGTDKDCGARSRLDLAHELAHLTIHRSVRSEQLKKSSLFKTIEGQAFRFAGAFLLPEKAFLSDVYSLSLDTLRALKSKWRVSIAAMISRLSELGLLTEDQERRMWINYNRRGWKQNEPFESQIEIEKPMLLQKSMEVILQSGISREQVPMIVGHGPKQIQSIANLSDHYFEPPSPPINVIPFRRKIS